MDKRYYSARHRKMRRNYTVNNENEEKSGNTFILRLNICLGIAIITVGIYQLNSDIGQELKEYLTKNTSIETIKEAASGIKNIANESKNVGFFDLNEDFTLNKESIEYINNMEENSYYNIQKKLETPNEVWIQPVDNGAITDVFGSRVNPITGKNENHKGLDIGVPLETEAKAVKSGEVIDEGYSNSYGNWIKYKTYDGYEILYAHLTSVVAEKNQKIKQGEVIAYTGSTGNSTGPHLHYEIMENKEYLNPYNYYMEASVENKNK